MESKTVYKNVKFPANIAELIKLDAARMKTTAQRISETMAADWFAQNFVDRAKKYEKAAK